MSWDKSRAVGVFQYDPDFHLGDIEIAPLTMPVRSTPYTFAIVRAQEIARAEIGFIVEKSRFFDRHRDTMNERQTRATERMFREGRRGFAGGMTAKKYMAITKCPPATATRDLSAIARETIRREKQPSIRWR